MWKKGKSDYTDACTGNFQSISKVWVGLKPFYFTNNLHILAYHILILKPHFNILFHTNNFNYIIHIFPWILNWASNSTNSSSLPLKSWLNSQNIIQHSNNSLTTRYLSWTRIYNSDIQALDVWCSYYQCVRHNTVYLAVVIPVIIILEFVLNELSFTLSLVYLLPLMFYPPTHNAFWQPEEFRREHASSQLWVNVEAMRENCKEQERRIQFILLCPHRAISSTAIK